MKRILCSILIIGLLLPTSCATYISPSLQDQVNALGFEAPLSVVLKTGERYEFVEFEVEHGHISGIVQSETEIEVYSFGLAMVDSLNDYKMKPTDARLNAEGIILNGILAAGGLMGTRSIGKRSSSSN